ncbi:hypothetical protein [Paraburkholderia domus]|uniref:hypothetical protein n=1 Tax=Paraburkholderia domus TaxID=2793075 RepID=UPI0019126E50|nr:hypothetical protein [Paraburkholderia domus]MBK5182166.1 hypothetical protein [Burkholderia sp. R-69749]CAE6842294.1 hypothetical protein R69749_04513 [Paraburkholderia domus]
MTRFKSLASVPNHTRSVLRRRFSFLLPKVRQGRHLAPDIKLYEEEVVLRLFQELSWVKAEAPDRALEIFEANRADPESARSCLEKLIDEGWICEGWHRLTVSYDVARAAEQAFPPSSPFRNWLDARYLTDWRWDARSNDDDPVEQIVNQVLSGATRPANIACLSPEWVSARLWDRKDAGPENQSMRLLWWVERWMDLGSPDVSRDAWSSADSEAFQVAALAVSVDESHYRGWDEYRKLLLQLVAHVSNRDPADFSEYVDAVPKTLVGRVAWLDNNRVERLSLAIGEAAHFSLGLVRILCRMVEQQEGAAAPHPTFATLVDFGMSHPEILGAITGECHDCPRLLADLLMHPPSSPLACKIIAAWRHIPEPWERDLFQAEAARSTCEAFTDAVDVMVHWLEQGRVPPEDVAAVYWWLHGRRDGGNSGVVSVAEELLQIFRARLKDVDPALMVSMADALIEAAVGRPVESAQFVAALDFVDVFKIERVNPEVLTLAYVLSIQGRSPALSVSGISPSAAVTLCRLASRTGSYGVFLNPFDIRQRLRETEEETTALFMLIRELSNSVGAHIRILSRAVASIGESVSKEIVDALANAIRIGALAHREKGKVPAFAPSYEAPGSWSQREGSIAADLGVAISKLDDSSLEKVLVQILETDEPGFLAQLSSWSPPLLRRRFERRIDALVPEEAAELWSIVDLQKRIEDLLNGGFAGAAAQFMTIETSATTLGPGRGRETMRLRFALHLAFMQEDWKTIDTAVLPEKVEQMDRQSLMDLISFYQALSQVKRPGGNLDRAVTTLEALHRQNPQVQSYATNLFAAKLSRVMGGDAFAILTGAKLREGIELLSEYEQLSGRSVTGADAHSLGSNKALLLLAVGRPEDAHVLLRAEYAERATAQIAAYDAVALARVGRHDEALELLTNAATAFGTTPLLDEVRHFIGASVGPMPKTATGVALSDGSAESEWSAAGAGEAPFTWDNSPDKFHSLMVTSVSGASAGLMSLMLPALSRANLDENGLSAVMRELLTGRLQKFGWSVPDQSLGSQTVAGNPGERDLVIKHANFELSVIEAVICNGNAKHAINRRELVSHLNKLFGYGLCRIFFHLTYCFDSVVADTIEVLKEIAENEVFDGAKFKHIDEMPSFDSRPDGFAAHYVLDRRTVTVVFLALNLGQRTQKDAMVEAARRKRKTTSGNASHLAEGETPDNI